MKTTVLFTAMVLIGLTSANATTTKVAPKGEDFTTTTRYRYAEPILFVERGIEFLIFPDGSFDFNTNAGNSFGATNDNYYYRGGSNNATRRGSVNTTQGAPGTISRSTYYGPASGGVLIQHDFDGKVRRIGNVFINYDNIGRVKRVGTVYMSYNRGGMLTQVGGLRLTYNNWGEIVNSYGVINASNMNYNYGLSHSNGNAYGVYNHFENDNDYYYYRQGKDVKKQKKLKK